ncbi:MAG TPA: ATP-binding protein [Gemmataceae bacterium]
MTSPITRLTAPIFAVSILLLGLGVGAAWHVHRLQRSNSDLLADNFVGMRAAQKLEIGIREVHTQFGRFLINGDRKHLDRVPTLREQTEYWLGEAERSAKTEEEVELMARVRAGYDHFFREYDRLTSESAPHGVYWEISALIDPVLTNEILVPAHEFLELNEKLMQANELENQALADRLVWGLLILGTCGASGGLLAGLTIALVMRRRMVQVQLRLQDTAEQLNEVVGPITLTGGPGLRDLDFDLQKLAEPIRKVVRRLHQSQREVMRAEQLAWVGQIAAGIAHEVRNPLTTMKILIQAATEREAGELSPRDLQVLEEEIGRLERLIGSFLEFARPPKTEKRPFELDRVFRQTLGLIRPRAEAAGVTLKCRLPRPPLTLEADIGQVHQVLFNLLLNALQASPRGGTVTVEAKPARIRRRGGRYLVLSVRDEGPGLPGDLGDQIFEPFVSTKESGMGLGLSICRRIVEAHGGRVTAADHPGGGAVFTVTLPLSARAEVPGEVGDVVLARAT